MPHVRSKQAVERRSQRRKAKDIMYDYSFNDKMNGDVVNLLRPEQVIGYLSKYYSSVIVEIVPCAAIPGCVLSDPYGAGAFQMEPKQK